MNRRGFFRWLTDSVLTAVVLFLTGCRRRALHEGSGSQSEGPKNPTTGSATGIDDGPAGYCGLFCGACSVLRDTREGNLAAFAAHCQVSTGEVECHGCRSSVVAYFCRDCKIRACAKEKGLESCADCDQCPCDKLTAFQGDGIAHHALTKRNLESIRRQGRARWLDAQRVRWQCPSCGSPACFYEKLCRKCGRELRDCREELADK